MSHLSVNGISLHLKVVGHGYPLVLMHGGPGADLYTLMSFRPLADIFTLIFYDHRCNGRSTGADVSTMTWENLTADADALRQVFGFGKWAVLGHSFGGNVALEYALRYPDSLSHLILVDTGGDHRWAQENASKVLKQRGFNPQIVDLTNRYFNGQIEPKEMFPALMKLGKAYNPHTTLKQAPHMIFYGLQSKLQPEAFIYSETHFLKGWTVMDRLGEIKVPTLIMAGRDDFIYLPEHQEELAALIPNTQLILIDNAGHNPHDEQTAVVINAVRKFLNGANPADS